MKTCHRVVVTAGISVFNSFNHYRAWTNETGVFRFDRTNPLPLRDEDAATALQRWERALAELRLDGDAADPDRISAEVSLLHALRVQRRLAENPVVALIHIFDRVDDLVDLLGGGSQ